MNDVNHRFGFSEKAVHGRVPGPFVPLQDEPHEVTGVRAKKTTKTVLVPQIHKGCIWPKNLKTFCENFSTSRKS